MHPLNMYTRAELARLATGADINMVDWMNRPAVDLEVVKRRLRDQGVMGTLTTPNGVEVSGPPGLIAALADVKPLPWKWIGFGALVAGMALWSWMA